MTTETMTVHKALAELKLLDSRIINEIGAGCFCSGKKHSEKFINGIPVEEVIKKIQGSYDKVTDLIKRRKAIKKAVVLSNARTEVEIAGVKYTVAEAIEMKNHGVEFDKKLASVMIDNLNKQIRKADSINGDLLETRTEAYITSLYGNKEARKGMSTEAEEARQKFIDSNMYEIVDPLHISDVVCKMHADISGFMADVDSALSCSNALTVIEITY